MFLHLERVVDRYLCIPSRLFVEPHAVELRAGELVDYFERARLVVEEVVVGAEEVAKTVVLVEAPHLVGDPFAALHAILPLVVGRDGAVRTGEFAAEGQDEGTDGTALLDLIHRHRARAEGRMPARRLHEPVPKHRVGQFVEIPEEALNTRVDQFLGNPVLVAARINQTGDIVERPAVARTNERRPHRFTATARRQHRFDETQQDKFLARDDDIGATRAGGVGTKQVIRLVDGVRTAGDDQRPMRGVDPVGVTDQLHALLGMQAHARDHEHVGDPAVELHLRRPEIAVPLLQDDAGLVESGVYHGRAYGPDTRGYHPRVGEDER